MNHLHLSRKNDGGFLIISSNICNVQFSLKEVFFEAPCTFVLQIQITYLLAICDPILLQVFRLAKGVANHGKRSLFWTPCVIIFLLQVQGILCRFREQRRNLEEDVEEIKKAGITDVMVLMQVRLMASSSFLIL